MSLDIRKQSVQQIHYITKISLADCKLINTIHSNFYIVVNVSDLLEHSQQHKLGIRLAIHTQLLFKEHHLPSILKKNIVSTIKRMYIQNKHAHFYNK